MWPLAFVAWAPLVVALEGQRARRAAMLGGAQGVVAVGAGFYWLPSVIKTFGDLPFVLCALIALALFVYSAGRFALLAWLYARATSRGWARELALGCAFAASELAYPLVFPWFTAAQLHRVPRLLQAADLGGPILVGLPLALCGAAVAEPFLARRASRSVRLSRVVIGLAPLLAALAYGAWRMPAVERAIAAAPPVRVGVVQGNLPHQGATLARSVAVHREATARLVGSAPALDLVLWPETAIGGVVDARDLEGRVRRDVVGAASVAMPPILSGVMVDRGGAFTNSAILFDGAGNVRGSYDKVHPLLVGERIPFGDRFPAIYRFIPNAGRVAPGAAPTPIPLGERRIAVLICYEDLLPDYANEAVAFGAPELLVNLTNDSWFGGSTAAAAHFALAKLRAVEHRRFFVRAANSGVSAFVDPLGRSWGETPLGEAATRVAELRWMTSRTAYERIGDAPFWAVSVFAVLMGMVSPAAFRRRRARAGASDARNDYGEGGSPFA